MYPLVYYYKAMVVKKIVVFSLYILSTFFLPLDIVDAKHNGFTLKLIHSDSINSPMYPGNLSFTEKLERMYNQTSYHISYMEKKMQGIQPDVIRAPVEFHQVTYLVQVGIGTFDSNHELPYKNFHLVVDTGSDLIWTQCENTIEPFPQPEPLYPFTRSTTYRPLPCNKHPLCSRDKCEGDLCSYTTAYLQGSSSSGLLASETFTFGSSDNAGGIESVDNIVFGCGNSQRNFAYGPDNKLSGIFGIGFGPRSFINQLGERGNGKYSYCLQSWSKPWLPGSDRSTFLRFGNDAKFKEGEEVYTTPLLTRKDMHVFFVNLLDVSVADKRLNFPPRSFALKRGGTGGCALDIGSSLTLMSGKEYNKLRSTVVAFLAPFRLREVRVRVYDLCYQHSQGSINLPVITFHFENADFRVGPGAFLTTPEYFCLAIIPHDYKIFSVVIGNHLQTHYRFLYNINDMTVSFSPEGCDDDV